MSYPYILQQHISLKNEDIFSHILRTTILLFAPSCLLEHLLFPNAGCSLELRVVVSCPIFSVS